MMMATTQPSAAERNEQYGQKNTVMSNTIVTSNDLCWRLRHLVLGYHGVQLLVAPEPWTQSTQAMQQHPTEIYCIQV